MDAGTSPLEGSSTPSIAPLGLGYSRRGPRPLALHIGQAELAWRAGNPRKLRDFYRGIDAYRRHPYRRKTYFRSKIWERGCCKLLDYGPEKGWPLLVIPSLINRADILDLMPDASMLGFLSQHGVRSLLLDWGEEATSADRLTLDQLILERMKPALEYAHRLTGMRPMVLGYCMGGTLATALACLAERQIAGLCLLAAPWNFALPGRLEGLPPLQMNMLASLSGIIGGTPVDLLQTLFAQIDPLTVPKKFSEFAKLDPSSTTAVRFVAIEDWLNDGTSLNAEIANECFLDWYGNNIPGCGSWQIDGFLIRPHRLELPVWLAVPERDRIVPPKSALALADVLKSPEVIRPKSGHVGMVAGQNAEKLLWRPLLSWLEHIAALQKTLGDRASLFISSRVQEMDS